MNSTITIVGASVRAAAQAAVRAGLRPWLADLFGDRDTLAAGSTVRIQPYPEGLLELFGNAPQCPWMYTGALENYPDLVDRLAAKRPLMGVSGESLRRVRDPFEVVRVLKRGGFSAPEVRSTPPSASEVGQWLRKSWRSSAGRGVQQFDAPGFAVSDATSEAGYFQRRIAGQPVSAAFRTERGQTTMLGATMQLIGNDGSRGPWCTADWTGARNFWYAGSVGPLALPPVLEQRLRELGRCLADSFKLIGPFGIDGILSGETFWLIEVNPRYTASMEVLERQAAGATGMAGKAVLYARGDLVVTERFSRRADELNAGSTWPSVADLPHLGGVIRTGEPICTVLTAGESHGEVIKRLRKLSDSARRSLPNGSTASRH